MAEIAVNRVSDSLTSIIEDPTLTNNRIFINGQSYNTTTVSANWGDQWHYTYLDKWINRSWVSGGLTYYGVNTYTDFCPMQLEKGTVQVYAPIQGAPHNQMLYDTYFRSLDFANYPVRKAWKTIGGNNLFISQSTDNTNETNDLLFTRSDVTALNSAYYYNSAQGMSSWCWEDTQFNRIYGFASGTRVSDLVQSISFPDRQHQVVVDSTVITVGANVGRAYFMGTDSMGYTWWMWYVDNAAGCAYEVRKINPLTLASTTMLTGSQRLGANLWQTTRPSNIRRPNDTRRVFYSSHFDNLGILAPIRYIWDTVTSSLLSTNCTMTYNASEGYSTHASMYLNTGFTAGNTNTWGIKGHQFSNAGIDYITYFVQDMAANVSSGPTRWAALSSRTAMTYTIGTNSVATLTAASITGTTLSFTSTNAALSPGMVISGGTTSANTILLQPINNLSWIVSNSQTVTSGTLLATPIISTLTGAAISGTTLTFATSTGSTVEAGMIITGSNVLAGTYIVSGSSLTWTVNQAQIVTATTLIANRGGALFNANITPGIAAAVSTITGGVITGNVLSLTSVAGAAISTGMVLTGGTVVAGTYIVSGSGLSWIVNQAQSVTSATLTGTPILMSVTGTVIGTIVPGMILSGSSITLNTVVTGVGTGIGGAGTYLVSVSQTVPAINLTGLLYTDDKLLFHSKLVYTSFSDLPRNWMPINAAGTQLAVATNAANLTFYNFNPTLGWISSGSYGAEFRQIGLDQTNRLWGNSREKGWNTIHLITPTMPITINIVMASSSYTYSGTNVSTTATVNAYGSLGTRIASSVTLTIDGSSMVFTSNGTKTLVVSTSDSADTTIGVTITGGGINNIVASVSV